MCSHHRPSLKCREWISQGGAPSLRGVLTRPVAQTIAAILLVGFLLGCVGSSDRLHRFREAVLTERQSEARVRQVDEAYAPPRTVANVQYSLATALTSITRYNRHEILWRGARSALWLAEHVADSVNQREYASLGLRLAEESVRVAPERVEGPFFQALHYGALSKLDGTSAHLGSMATLGNRAIELDETFDHAGPHRFLGLLYYKTESRLFTAGGSLEDALTHLHRACELAPGYSINHLAYAQALAEDDQIAKAKNQLRAAIQLTPPLGDEDRHAEWVATTREALGNLKN